MASEVTSLIERRGRSLEPPRTLIWITAERASRLEGIRLVALRFDAELLAARDLALVPFPQGFEPREPR